jgi:hypothetical protein
MNTPFVSRRVPDSVPDSGTPLESRVPAWIDQVPRIGWPVVAVIAMIMCAPGEHHLAIMAGYTDRIAGVELAWGMPACLVAYAGIAASVATRRAKGTQGRRTAVAGAFLSLGAAMSAQPISHMFVTGHWDSDPAPVWIVWAVSVVPPLVVGHLMHMAASHTVSRRRSARVPDAAPAVPSPQDKDKTVDTIIQTFDVPRDIALGDTDTVSPVHSERPVRPVRPRVPSLGDKQTMSARALELVRQGQDDEDIKAVLRDEFRDTDTGRPPLANSINKAVTRARDKMSRTA